MPGLEFSFRLLPAWDMDVDQWSYGTIERPEDLYSQRVFGAMQDLRCQCGALSGQQAIDDVCARCGVVVQSDARTAAKRRMAKTILAYDWGHLWTGKTLRRLPVLPWPFRLDDAKRPNTLGRRYERFIEVNSRLTREHTAPETLHDPGLRAMESNPELDDVLADLFEGTRAASRIEFGEPGSLSDLLHRSIRSADPDVDIVFRACGFSFSIHCAC